MTRLMRKRRLKPLGEFRFRRFFCLPLALLLWPLVEHNYCQRENGERPDQWYWADRWLGWMGFCLHEKGP